LRRLTDFCQRGGRSWALTDESIQRMYAVGALPRFEILSRIETRRMRVCEHMIRPIGLGDRLRHLVRRPLPKAGYLASDLVGKRFTFVLDPTLLANWEKWATMGVIAGRIGEYGPPLYFVAIMPDWSPHPRLALGDESVDYLIASEEIRLPRWHIYESYEQLLGDYIRRTGHPPVPVGPSEVERLADAKEIATAPKGTRSSKIN